MIMAKQCISIEQTQHLQEFGVDTSKASMCWWRRVRDFRGEKVEGRWNISLNKPYIVQNFEQNEDIPAFTLQDILDLLPAKHEGAYLTITKTDKFYIMGYEDEDGGASPVFINEQAIDSAYEMLCWCAKNGIIETKKDES